MGKPASSKRGGDTSTARSHCLPVPSPSGIDGHFAIEQTARSANHLFLNFNGTAGIWRRTTIEDAGGWTADTLTEDLDLSYRAQLKGWHLEYVSHVVAPAELPDTYSAFKSQQFRWAKGSIQTSIKLFPAVFASDRSYLAKLQSIFHLCHYFAHPLMLLVALMALPALQFFGGSIHQTWLIVLAIPLLASTFGPAVLYTISQRYLYPTDWFGRILLLPVLMVVGFGICLSNTRAVLRSDSWGEKRLRAHAEKRFHPDQGLSCTADGHSAARNFRRHLLHFQSRQLPSCRLSWYRSVSHSLYHRISNSRNRQPA
jgi:cellulose synthase/poly-beta-1,6-N-acetylglucosamine synthase-like glycosyltransferase